MFQRGTSRTGLKSPARDFASGCFLEGSGAPGDAISLDFEDWHVVYPIGDGHKAVSRSGCDSPIVSVVAPRRREAERWVDAGAARLLQRLRRLPKRSGHR